MTDEVFPSITCMYSSARKRLFCFQLVFLVAFTILVKVPDHGPTVSRVSCALAHVRPVKTVLQNIRLKQIASWEEFLSNCAGAIARHFFLACSYPRAMAGSMLKHHVYRGFTQLPPNQPSAPALEPKQL